MNQNISPTLAENPNASAQDADTFWNMDTLAAKARKTAQTVGKTLDTTAKEWGTNTLETFGKKVVSAKDKKVAKTVGYAEEAGVGMGIVMLGNMLMKRKKNKNISTTSTSPTESGWKKWLVGGVLAAGSLYAISNIDLFKGLGFGSFSDQIKKLSDMHTEAEKQYTTLSQQLQTTQNEVLKKELETKIQALQREMKTLDENRAKILTEAQNSIEERLKQTKSLLNTEEKKQSPNNEEIRKLQSEIIALEKANQGLGNKDSEGKSIESSHLSEIIENKEIPAELQIYWKDIIAICVENGVISSDYAKGMTNQEDFKKFIIENFHGKEITEMLTGNFESMEQKKKLMITGMLLLLMFLSKGVFNKILKGGVILSLVNIANGDLQNAIRERDKYIKTIEDISALLDKKAIENGFDKTQKYAWLESIFGIETMMLVQSSFILSPEFANKNDFPIKNLIDTLQKKQKTEEQTDAISNLEQLRLLSKISNVRLSNQEITELFLPLQLLELPIIVKKSKTLGYSIEITIENQIFIIDQLPINPFPDILPEERKAEKYKEKEKDLLRSFEQSFNEYYTVFLKTNNPQLLYSAKNNNSEIESTIEKIQAMLKQEIEKTMPSNGFVESSLLPLLQQLETAGLGEILIESGILFFKDKGGKITRVGLTQSFDKKTNDPRYITTLSQEEMENSMMRRYKELGGEAILDVRKNLQSFYVKLPDNSPLKLHLSIYLANKTEQADEQILNDAIWWGQFLYLLVEDPTEGTFVKVKDGVMSVVSPWGEFFLMSALDPIYALFDSANCQELLIRSFVGGGLALGITGAATEILTGKGVTGKAVGAITKGTSGLVKGSVMWNPVVRPFYEAGKLSAKIYAVNKISSGKYTELFKINKERILKGHFLGNSVQVVRHYFGGDPFRYFMEKYVNLIKEQNLYKSVQGGSNPGMVGKHFFNSIEKQRNILQKTFQKIYGKESNALWNEFTKAADEIVNNSRATFESAIKKEMPTHYFSNKLEMTIRHSFGNIANTNKAFSDLRTEIQSVLTNNTNWKNTFQHLLHISYGDELYALVNQYHSGNAGEIKTALQNLNTTIQGLPEETIADQKENIKKLSQTITSAINSIDAGKNPKLIIGKINPLRAGWKGFLRNTRIIPTGYEAKIFAMKGLNALGGAAAGVDIVGNNGVGAVYNAIDALRTEEGQGDTYLFESGANVAFGGAKAWLAYGSASGIATVPSLLLYSAVSGTEKVVMGGFEAQHQAEWSSAQFKGKWTKEKLLHEIAFMAGNNADDAIKNAFHEIIKTIPFSNEEEREKAKGHNKEQIREIVWQALGLYAAEEQGDGGNSYWKFYEAYMDCIRLKTDEYKKSDFSMFDIQELNKKATEYAQRITEGYNAVIDSGVIPEKYKRNEQVLGLVFNTFQKKEVPKHKEVENNLSKLDDVIYHLAVELYKYNGPKEKKSLQEFFNDPKKGIYWDEPGIMHSATGGVLDGYTGWKIHRIEGLVLDESLDKKTDEENIAHLLQYINSYPSSIFTSEQYGTNEKRYDDIKKALDKLGESAGIYDLQNDQNRENMYKGSHQAGKEIIQYTLNNSVYKNTIMQEKDIFTKGMMIFALADGYNGIFSLPDIQKKYALEKFESTFDKAVRWDETKKEWYAEASGIPRTKIESVDFIIQAKLDHGDGPLVGQLRTLKQCMQIAKELSTTSPATPSS